ncbi:MAG: DNA-binding response regulator [Stigonema ocellatum SAG 48.90 = DSM 106950]|nr:DNA-binding response regulator [Stigonema ocellatum SAG 48.90 = DSM 106950]
MAKKILVIENSPKTRRLFLECLEANGFLTISAEDGLMGIQRVHEDLPDVIIIEIVMPKLDGYKVLTKLRQNPNTAIIPFIFVTAQATRTDIRKGIEMGADDYLTKPCTTEELLRAIRACLEKQAVFQKWYTAQSQQLNMQKKTVSQSISPSDSQLNEVFQFIEANYHQSIGLDEVAQALCYSPSYLTGLVKQKTGQTINHWIIKRRITAAQVLLMETDLRVNQIAQRVGYQNANHFFRQFRQYHGITPQTWRNTYRSQVGSMSPF